jgi:tryptophan-rich sensory protein
MVRPRVENQTKKERIFVMLYTIAVVLIVLWLLGFVSSYTMGGLIHVLLVIAIVLVLVRVISGRKAV